MSYHRGNVLTNCLMAFLALPSVFDIFDMTVPHLRQVQEHEDSKQFTFLTTRFAHSTLSLKL